jgi:hypothetical protein
MVREAYKLLKYYIGQDIREMKDHVGYNEEGNGQFNPGGKIVIGAYQEDHSDATNEGYGIGGYLVTNTHFWDPDLGDYLGFDFAGIGYSNAYQKSKKYMYGGYELRVPYPANQIIEAYDAPPNLIQFYKDGIIFYKGYYEMATGEFVPRNRWHTASMEFRNKVVWEILGRICHLLGDMTIPAHTHNDPHWPDLDSYEEWMNQPTIYNQWTYQNAINQGGLIIPNSLYPVKSLFYPTAQITNFFSSNDVDGNNINGSNDAFILYPGLSEMIQHLNSEFNGPPDKTVHWLSGTSDHAFVYGIRTMAGLLYWFAKEADLLPTPLTYVYVSGTYELYLEQTGYWTAQPGNGLEPFTYQWEIKYLDGAGYLQTYESVKKEKEKREKDKDKKKDGDIIIETVISNYWFSVGTNSSIFSKTNNSYDYRDFMLRCTVTDGSGTTKTSNEWFVDVLSTSPPQYAVEDNGGLKQEKYIANAAEEESVPTGFSLGQNYPNPFNPTTRISYSLPEANFVTLKIYDMLGSEVAALVNENRPAGRHEVEFDASRLSSGTYVYKLIAGNYQVTKKMQFVK